MGHEKTYIQSSRPWECGNPEGISKECGKGGKPALWLSMLSALCHFHRLLLWGQMLEISIFPVCRNLNHVLDVSRIDQAMNWRFCAQAIPVAVDSSLVGFRF